MNAATTSFVTLSAIGKPIVLALLGFAVAVALLATGLLFYHWRKFGITRRVILITEIVYVFGVVLLLGIAFLITNSL